MTILVNVEDMNFDDLKPYLKDHEELQKEYYKRAERFLEILFNKLQEGETAEHYVIGHYMIQCLEKMGRVLANCNNPDNDNDFYIQPITKSEIEKFLKGINDG